MAYRFPSTDLLQKYRTDSKYMDKEYVKAMAEDLSKTLKAYKIDARITDVRMTPFAVKFDVVPDPGVSIKKIKNLRLDLEMWMAAPVEITVASDKQFVVDLAIKSLNRPIVGLRDIIESDEFRNSDYKLPVAAGMDVLGKPFCFDIAEATHLLIAGTTGSGKSVFLNDIILSLLFTKTAEEVRMIMIDPKKVELGPYNGIPHLLFPVINDTDQALSAIQWVEREMARRYKLFSEMKAKTIEEYNQSNNSDNSLPRLLVIVDEYMEMMFQAPKQLEESIANLARSGRAAGIHLILATQRPSSDVITSKIKTNIPCRASFTVIDWRESKTIIDRTGAERLLGSGDMLFSSGDSAIPIHAQASFVSDEEIDTVIEEVKNQARL